VLEIIEEEKAVQRAEKRLKQRSTEAFDKYHTAITEKDPKKKENDKLDDVIVGDAHVIPNPKVRCVVPVLPMPKVVSREKRFNEKDIATPFMAMSLEEVNALSTTEKRQRTRIINKFQTAQANQLREAQQAEEKAMRMEQAKRWEEVEMSPTSSTAMRKEKSLEMSQENKKQHKEKS